MDLEDRVVVATPEGVDLELVVAGLGSRFMSSLVDTTLQVVLFGLVLVVAALVGSGFAVALIGLGVLIVAVVLPACFDAFGSGRTPGRRATGLRLVMADGAAVTLIPAAVRNVVRLVDFLPALYSVGVIAVLATPRNQRLGDLAAGTIVVRAGTTRAARTMVVPGATRPESRRPASDTPPTVGWDLTGLSAADEGVVRSFLTRRDALEPAARARVAEQLARRLEPVVVGPDRSAGDEVFLEQVLAARESRAT